VGVKAREGAERSVLQLPLAFLPFVDLPLVAPLRCRQLWQAPTHKTGVASN
jgi:hypothetical protein